MGRRSTRAFVFWKKDSLTIAMLHRVMRFVKPYRAFLVLAFLGALGEAAADLLQPWPLKLLFDHIFSHRPLPPQVSWFVAPIFGQQTQDLLYFVLAAVIGIAALNAASSYTQDFFMPRISH